MAWAEFSADGRGLDFQVTLAQVGAPGGHAPENFGTRIQQALDTGHRAARGQALRNEWMLP